MSQTDIVGAGRYQSPIHPMMAQVAFLGHIRVLIESDGIVRAGIDAESATGADFIIHNYQTVVSFDNGLIRTGIHTGGIITVPAKIYFIFKIQLAVDDPGSILCNKNEFDPVS
jgi:hypothetical protein